MGAQAVSERAATGGMFGSPTDGASARLEERMAHLVDKVDALYFEVYGAGDHKGLRTKLDLILDKLEQRPPPPAAPKLGPWSHPYVVTTLVLSALALALLTAYTALHG